MSYFFRKKGSIWQVQTNGKIYSHMPGIGWNIMTQIEKAVSEDQAKLFINLMLSAWRENNPGTFICLEKHQAHRYGYYVDSSLEESVRNYLLDPEVLNKVLRENWKGKKKKAKADSASIVGQPANTNNAAPAGFKLRICVTNQKWRDKSGVIYSGRRLEVGHKKIAAVSGDKGNFVHITGLVQAVGLKDYNRISGICSTFCEDVIEVVPIGRNSYWKFVRYERLTEILDLIERSARKSSVETLRGILLKKAA